MVFVENTFIVDSQYDISYFDTSHVGRAFCVTHNRLMYRGRAAVNLRGSNRPGITLVTLVGWLPKTWRPRP